MGGGCSIAPAELPASVRPREARCRPTRLAGLSAPIIGWNPVTNLNFDFELMYQSTSQAAPSGFIGTIYNQGGVGGAFFQPGGWKGISDGFAGRLRVTRYF